MAEHSIYRDIAERTGGDIYIGVVGPVRTGKSTFIKRFMEALVLPNIEDSYSKDRARDEMPQSAAGKTVMTTEPKFVPDEVKMIDCVGYIVNEALGTIENGQPRMVHTPWQEEPMPFVEAAEMGTEKVIREHSTIGMLITTDGTIGEISRESYLPAEERIVNELKSLGKPFAMILNSADPTNENSIALAYELEAKYNSQRNIITRAIGIAPEVEPDTFVAIAENGRALLCSDGLTAHLDDSALEKVLSDFTISAEDVSKTFVTLANEAGGTDNITVVTADTFMTNAEKAEA